MSTNAPRFMVAAAHKSSGKTVISTGLTAALSARGVGVTPFKKGPDYIDPMWLASAAGRPCYNLDFNAMQREEVAPFFAGRAGALSLVEANKGLFDGVSADGCDSNAELAKLLSLPVVLVIDTTGMTRGIAPLLLGYTAFDPEVNIAGVILNKVGGTRHEGKLRAAVEAHTDLPVLGAIGRDRGLEIGERHLGLTTPAELSARDALIARFAETVAASVDLERVQAVAQTAPALEEALAAPAPPQVGKGLTIGIPRDAAFGFYYPDDLEAFRAAGARLAFFDALNDEHLPAVDALFIGGGFPEMRMRELSANRSLRLEIRQALAEGLPAYAECGGLMYLCESLSWGAETHEMVGAVPARAVMHRRPQGRGYVAFTPTPAHPWPASGPVRAHEFHYASLEGLPPGLPMARRITRGHGIDGQGDGLVIGNLVAGFCHLRNTGGTDWVGRFLRFVRERPAGQGRSRRA